MLKALEQMKARWNKLTEGEYGLVIYFFVGAITALVLYHGVFAVILNTNTPVVSVLSDSMIPVFFRGDMLIIYNDGNYKKGDIVVYESKNMRSPIIHRIIDINNGFYITKGDNNRIADPYPVAKEDIKGRAIFKIPLLGWARIGFQAFMDAIG